MDQDSLYVFFTLTCVPLALLDFVAVLAQQLTLGTHPARFIYPFCYICSSWAPTSCGCSGSLLPVVHTARRNSIPWCYSTRPYAFGMWSCPQHGGRIVDGEIILVRRRLF